MPKVFSISAKHTALIAITALALSGCKARELGVSFADTQAQKVDPTWITAIKSCWPGIDEASFNTESLEHMLADPIHFRAAFAPYAVYTDADIENIAAHAVTLAPTPDPGMLQNSPTTVLTTAEALHSSTAPKDAFCAVHAGLPVGFK